jgi:hypothetical protein
VNAYVKAMLWRWRSCGASVHEPYSRYVRLLDRKRDRLVAEVDRRRALIGTQLDEAQRILRGVRAAGATWDRTR